MADGHEARVVETELVPLTFLPAQCLACRTQAGLVERLTRVDLSNPDSVVGLFIPLLALRLKICNFSSQRVTWTCCLFRRPLRCH